MKKIYIAISILSLLIMGCSDSHQIIFPGFMHYSQCSDIEGRDRLIADVWSNGKVTDDTYIPGAVFERNDTYCVVTFSAGEILADMNLKNLSLAEWLEEYEGELLILSAKADLDAVTESIALLNKLEKNMHKKSCGPAPANAD